MIAKRKIHGPTGGEGSYHLFFFEDPYHPRNVLVTRIIHRVTFFAQLIEH